jgi:hypothetical protein
VVAIERIGAEIARLQKEAGNLSPAAFRASTQGKQIQALVAQREQILAATSAAGVAARSQPHQYK